LSHPPLLPWHIDRPHLAAHLGDLRLESGEVIRDYVQSYVTHGTLDAQRSNAVLICSAITGNHHRLDYLIGPGRAVDPARWFVVAVDAIGNGLSTSPSTSAHQRGARFPRFTIRDMVSAQRRLLLDKLGLSRPCAIIGASMGGMQALQWAVSHPEMVQSIVAMTAAARTSPWSIAVNEAARSSLMADPNWNGKEFVGRPERGWRAWLRMQRVLTSRSPESIERAFDGREDLLGFIDGIEQSWREGAFDAQDFLAQSLAYDAHDVGATPGFAGDLEAALRSIRARTLVLAPPLDLYNPVSGPRQAASAIPGALFVEIPSIHGHQATSGFHEADRSFLNEVIGKFLND
jgi:homoserine O-acetyltransferase